jgi:hypothetical protein
MSRWRRVVLVEVKDCDEMADGRVRVRETRQEEDRKRLVVDWKLTDRQDDGRRRRTTTGPDRRDPVGVNAAQQTDGKR